MVELTTEDINHILIHLYYRFKQINKLMEYDIEVKYYKNLQLEKKQLKSVIDKLKKNE